VRHGTTLRARVVCGWDDKSEVAPVKPRGEKLQWSDPVFAGAPERFPLQFQPYLSLQYHDGRGANLPWMQELPDPVSSSMWDLPLEIDPQTAAKLNIDTGRLGASGIGKRKS
jgi:hypothetical protein